MARTYRRGGWLVAFVAAILLISLTAASSAPAHPISKTTWLGRFLITEYFPAPERWFVGRRVAAPGIPGRHRVDWLYSGRGLSMEGDGVGLDGRRYHIAGLSRQGWVTERGRRTRPTRSGWSAGPPFWRAVGWRNRRGHVTFPFEGGGWYRGRGVRYIPPTGITFAPGPSRQLSYYRSVAVDPRLISLGSLVYIQAYRHTRGRGWFRAADTGGAILGRHLDVYRPAPPVPGGGNVRYRQRVCVVPPGRSTRRCLSN